jgi:hypothetical protein
MSDDEKELPLPVNDKKRKAPPQKIEKKNNKRIKGNKKDDSDIDEEFEDFVISDEDEKPKRGGLRGKNSAASS